MKSGRSCLFWVYTLAACLFADSVRADFDGPYSLTPPNPGNYSYPGFPPQSFGGWTASGGNSVINTVDAPEQLYLQVPSSYFFPQQLHFATCAVADGLVDFDAATVSSFLGSVSWFKQPASGTRSLVALDAGPSGMPTHYSINVQAGDEFGFLLTSSSDVILPGQPPYQTLTVSKFFAPVPEPGSGVLLLGGWALIAARAHRRHR